jgi:hypothetical protein
MKTNTEYLENPSQCPLCGSDEIEGGAVTIDAAGAFQEVHCGKCDFAYFDCYQLTGYEPIKDQEPAEPSKRFEPEPEPEPEPYPGFFLLNHDMVGDDRDKEIYNARLTEWTAKDGPRVGDFVIMPNGEKRRFAHHWGDSIQPTSGGGGSFYWYGPACSMSGGLDPAIPLCDLYDTHRVEPGAVWFFHHGYSGAHRAVGMSIPCRVYEYRKKES